MNKTIEKRVEAIERWITAFEIEEAKFEIEEARFMDEHQVVVFTPDPELLRNRKKDH